MRASRTLFCILTFLLAISLHASAAGPGRPPVSHPTDPLSPDSLAPLPRDAQSTTGPQPPPWVRDVHLLGGAYRPSLDAVLISDVPAYLWRHGCGPTAVGMVIGYWDRRGYDDLVPGDASAQTAAVQQMIASEGPASNYTDYCEPIDDVGDILPDLSEDPPGDEHPDNCVADYMRTSQSRFGNRYGWSYFSDIGRSFQSYVQSVARGRYVPSAKSLWTRTAPQLTWDVFRAEIDAGRPVVFLVDTDGNGGTDHFVTAIGHDRGGGALKYACLDTWYAAIRWENFAPIAEGNEWGIYGATLFRLVVPLEDVVVRGPTTAQIGQTCTFAAMVAPSTATRPVTYVWQATDQKTITHTVNSITDTVALAWAGSGAKTVRLYVSNEGGVMVDHLSTIIIDPLRTYLPLTRRP